jgi:uncharacterized protein DUF4157
MRAIAVQTIADPAIARKKNPDFHSVKVSPWFPNPASMMDAQIVSRKATCACGGGCSSCKTSPPTLGGLQISEPGDTHEREADAVADHVMRMSDGSAASSHTPREGSSASRPWTPSGVKNSAPTDLSSIITRGTSGGGHPLDLSTRMFMESRFGRDFGDVRIHTDNGAAASARAVSAVAYTIGNRIVFGAGHYSPHTTPGRRLLAHELTHTIQQSNSSRLLVGRFAAPAIQTGVTGILQLQCEGKNYSSCSGGCTHPSGGTGVCRWSGAIATGCVCYKVDQPRLRELQQFLYNLIINALIAAGIVLTAAAIAVIIACLLGPCEVAALIAALGYVGAMIVMGILGSGGGASGGNPPVAGAGGGGSNQGTAA